MVFQQGSAQQLLLEIHVTHKYSRPVLLVEPRSCVPGGRRLLSVAPPPCRAQTGPQRGSRCLTQCFGAVGGPVPAACPQGTPPLGSHRGGVCLGNTVGVTPGRCPCAGSAPGWKGAALGDGFQGGTGSSSKLSRQLRCRMTMSCAARETCSLGIGRGSASGEMQIHPEMISCRPSLGWGYFWQLSLCPRLR